jgi:hypothetical protein
LRAGWPAAALVYLIAVAIAYACLKLYDETVSKWLMNRALVIGGSENPVMEVSVIAE